MRQWRVGTLSMGISLIAAGIALALSMWNGYRAYDALLVAAPLILVLLGVELLVYMKLAGSERTTVRYDWISLFFVAVIGAGSLALSVLGSVGLLDEIRRAVRSVEYTVTMDPERQSVPEGVERIIVNGYGALQIDRSPEREVQLLGQYRYWRAGETSADEGASGAVLTSNRVGSTLYVWVSGPGREDGLARTWSRPSLTLIVPEQVAVETRGF